MVNFLQNKKRILFQEKITTVLIGLFVFLWAVPLLWMFALSLSNNETLRIITTKIIPVDFTLNNFIDTFKVGLISRWFLNSVIVSVFTTLFAVILSAMAGYAFAKLKFKGKNFLIVLVLVGMMVPAEAMFIPLFLMISKMNLHNTYSALIIPRIAVPLGVFIMMQFFKAIPKEIDEAAKIDGASQRIIFLRIALPMSLPAIITVALFVFISTWNDFLWPLVSATKKEMFTITTGLASLQGDPFAISKELGSIMARGVIAGLPLLIVFLIFQKKLLRGISMSGGIK